MQYLVNLSQSQVDSLNNLIQDQGFWPGYMAPAGIDQLVGWIVDDLLDYYRSYKKGCG